MLKRLIIFGLFLHLTFVIGNLSLAAETNYLTLVEMKRDRGYDYLDIYTSGNVQAKGLLLEDQLQINFPNTRVPKRLLISRRASKRIRDIHVIQANPQTARVIIDLKTDVDYDLVCVFGRNKTVVELGGRIDYTTKHMAAMEKSSQAAKQEKLQPAKIEPVKPAATAPPASYPLKGRTIILDPGHGGCDPGAISINGVPEKQLTLQTAEKVARLLQSNGATVYLTRNGDRTSRLQEIVSFANRTKADIFISIHYNFADQSSIKGTETYYYGKQSRRLALILHQSLIEGIHSKDRGLRRAPYYVVRHVDIPAVLLEPLYLSNPDEERFARSANNQTELAADIVRGVKSYFRSKPD